MKDLKQAPLYLARWSTISLALLGLFFLALAKGDGELPPIRRASTQQDPNDVLSPHCALLSSDAEERWVRLQPSLALAFDVIPEVGFWVRDLNEEGKVVFRESGPALAGYDFWSGELTIYGGFFAEYDGFGAAVLAHEYRHGRQSIPKRLLCGFGA